VERSKTRNTHEHVSKADKGNRLARLEDLNGQLHLRITTGNREFIYAKVLREPSNSKNKWITFMIMLLESWQTQSYFSYTVELNLRDGEVYRSVSFEIPTPKVKYTTTRMPKSSCKS